MRTLVYTYFTYLLIPVKLTFIRCKARSDQKQDKTDITVNYKL